MSDGWKREGRYLVSPFNYESEVTAGRINNPGTSTRLYDSTLRKILLTPGLDPRVEDLLDIAGALDRAGIRNLTLNLHWWGEREPEELELAVLRAVLAGGFRFTTTVTLDNVALDHWRSDLDMLSGLGVEEPVFIAWLPKAFDSSPEPGGQVARITEALGAARGLGMRPAVAIADVGRVRRDDLLQAVRLYVDAGADRLDIIDSVSSMTPEAAGWLFQAIRGVTGEDLPLLLHTHDDFGLGTAVAVATVAAGGHTEVSINGISDRAGFPALEEVAVVLETMYGIDTGIDMSQISNLCDLVARLTLPVHPWKAISGRQAWQVDLPYGYVPLLQHGARSFPPPWACVDPTWLGYDQYIPWVRQFITAPVLRLKLQALGLPTDEESIRRAKSALADALAKNDMYPVWVEEDEVDHLLASAVGSN